MTGAICAQAGINHQLTGPRLKDVAHFSQNVDLAGRSSTVLLVAPLTSSGAGFGLAKVYTRIPNEPLGSLLPVYVSNPTNQGTASTYANQWVANQFPVFKEKFRSWMNSRNITSGVLSYNQEINVSTPSGPVKKSISFVATIDSSGRTIWGAPKIVEADPTLLEVIYTPLRTKQDLPASWRYPDAGTLKWRLLSKAYAPITNWSTLNVSGAYDEANAPAGLGDPNALLNCLMDSRAAAFCPAVTDVRTLLADHGAAFALVSYVRSLEPDYEQDASGVQQAKYAMSVNERTLECSSYRNKGEYGFVLKVSADQYMATATNTGGVDFNLLQQIEGRSVSPTETYSKNVDIRSFGGTNADTMILSPDPAEPNGYWLRTDLAKMAKVVSVAPLQITVTDPDITSFSTSGVASISKNIVQGIRAIDYTFNLSTDGCTLCGTYGEVAWSWMGTQQYDPITQVLYWADRFTTPPLMSASFNLTDLEKLDQFHITNVTYDGFLYVAVNGRPVLNYPFGGATLQTYDILNAMAARYGWDGWYTGWGAEFQYSIGLLQASYNYDTGYMDPNTNVVTTAAPVPQLAPNGYGVLGSSSSPSIDLRPYLVNGTNTIEIRSAGQYKSVAKSFNIRAKGCGD